MVQLAFDSRSAYDVKQLQNRNKNREPFHRFQLEVYDDPQITRREVIKMFDGQVYRTKMLINYKKIKLDIEFIRIPISNFRCIHAYIKPASFLDIRILILDS